MLRLKEIANQVASLEFEIDELTEEQKKILKVLRIYRANIPEEIISWIYIGDSNFPRYDIEIDTYFYSTINEKQRKAITNTLLTENNLEVC